MSFTKWLSRRIAKAPVAVGAAAKGTNGNGHHGSEDAAPPRPVNREAIIGDVMWMVRDEYTVMPRFLFHQPLDYHMNTYPPAFAPPVTATGVSLPVPPPDERMGYFPNDTGEYLNCGKYDHDLIAGYIKKHVPNNKGVRILDFGCSSGRVLRHFDEERQRSNWELFGVDIQARPIEWLRQNFPQHFSVWTGSIMPHLPFPDGSFDAIYGISVFTHIKYLWDAWLLELRRVLRPGGLLMQTVHAEPAWDFYYKNQKEAWVRENHSAEMLKKPQMDVDFLYYGNACVSQVFWKEEVARRYWGRYFNVLEFNAPPPKYSFQSWMVCRNDAPRRTANQG